MLNLGDPAPHFRARSSINPQFNFDVAAGRYVVITFFGSLKYPAAERFLSEIAKRGERFDVVNCLFFGVTVDPDDIPHLPQQHPGRIYFYDLDLAVSKQFGAVSKDVAPTDGAANTASEIAYHAQTLVLDQALRVIGRLHWEENVVEQVDKLFAFLDTLPALEKLNAVAPVLIVPYVFEPAFCRRLIEYYETIGGYDSGFMREIDGKTVGKIDYNHKRRMDCELVDQELISSAHQRLKRRVVPAIQRAFQFQVTRIERNIIACYDAAQEAHFRAHRDNTTLGTAHRRFAVTLNLNSPEYEGGEIWFPEFGPRKFKAASGSAIVFSCSLLHEVPTVTNGKRYAYLPFLYDDAAAALRERNRVHLVGTEDGATAKECSATPGNPFAIAPNAPVIDGACGCGNPAGCNTCLSAATYALESPANSDARE